jgi:succinate-acetate transporter protein
VGLVTGIAALYVSFAEVTNATFNRNVIPLGTPILKTP